METSKLLSFVEDLFHKEQFDEAHLLIKEAIASISVDSSSESFFYQIKLHCLLIDIGWRNLEESDFSVAICFFEQNEEKILSCIEKVSYYYNLANAKAGVSKAYHKKNLGVHSLDETKAIHQEPIRLYWLAYNNCSKNSRLLPQILINLSGALVEVARLTEALQFLDIVLRTYPTFPEALVSRGDFLYWWDLVTNSADTVALKVQTYASYDAAINTNALPSYILEKCINAKAEALHSMQEHGFDASDIEEELVETQVEFDKHSKYRQYCLDNFLTLNEHGIYCKCVATEKDDLQIGVKYALFKLKSLPHLEVLLNRMKSEFALARWLYYQSISKETTVENDVLFSELYDGEAISYHNEMQRASFRLCYGILDKIALGVCKLYNLDSHHIQFETFWENKKRKPELDQIKNIHLNALYSIACDLNSKTGELRQFKLWRNDLEHNFLLLKDSSKFNLDIFGIHLDKEFVEVVDSIDFEKKCLHLLQLTRAAIFSYVHCVRLQTIEHPNEEIEKRSVQIGFKE